MKTVVCVTVGYLRVCLQRVEWMGNCSEIVSKKWVLTNQEWFLRNVRCEALINLEKSFKIHLRRFKRLNYLVFTLRRFISIGDQIMVTKITPTLIYLDLINLLITQIIIYIKSLNYILFTDIKDCLKRLENTNTFLHQPKFIFFGSSKKLWFWFFFLKMLIVDSENELFPHRLNKNMNDIHRVR